MAAIERASAYHAWRYLVLETLREVSAKALIFK